MSILEALKEDHKKLKSLIEQVLATQESRERGELIKQIRIELVAHSRAEEKILYRRMERSEEGKDEALEGDVEHEIAEQQVDTLTRSRSKGSDSWKARCSVFQELLGHHIEEEEGEFFDTARKLFDSSMLDKMEKEFQAEKARHGVGVAAE